MKVAFDHKIFTHQSYGGVSRYFSILADRLSKRSINVKAYLGIYQNNYISNLPDEIVNGIKIKKYPLKSMKLFYFANHFVSQAQIRSWKPDIIHETYYSSLPTINSNAICLTTAYDMIHELFESNFSKNDQTSKKKKEVFRRVDHILSISNNTKKDLVEIYGIDKSKISVVHLGVDLKKFKKNEITNLFEDMPYILYVGARGGYKNFNRFIKACAQSKIIKNNFKILAFGGGAFHNKELSIIKSLGFTDNIVKQVSGDDKTLAELYSNALCFVYPSLYEGFGLPPLEAMASGCPVASSNTSSMPEVINQAGEFFDPYETEEIGIAIERIINSDTRRKELIELGYKNVNLFRWDKCASETLEIYKKLIGNK